MARAVSVLGLLTGQTAIAHGQEGDTQYLSRVESPVFETVGTHDSIAKRAMICIAQVIKPGLVNAPTIVSSDTDAGIVVANNSFKYDYGSLLPVSNVARSTLTFQAKDGRFRIVHTNIEQFTDPQRGWIGIGTWRFAGGDAAKQAIEAISQSVASCVKANNAANDSW